MAAPKVISGELDAVEDPERQAILTPIFGGCNDRSLRIEWRKGKIEWLQPVSFIGGLVIKDE